MDAGLLCEDVGLLVPPFFFFLTKLSLISTRVLIACMCFYCMLHLSVCFYVDIYALVHIERSIA